ncbi:MAG: cob(I)yrinic acid a,c-diamide adenosyltransferase [Nanoarchaeota archaeon]|nr:cob(I)yrinic acid a,c-diamide adenosyltransferase [Nanoarchaeota archaeon]
MHNKGNIYLWTGNGWGKTTSALGVALRALGHGKKVSIIQFMKGRGNKIGEYRIRTKIPGYKIKQFGRYEWVNIKKPSEKDRELANKALEYAKAEAKKKPFLLVLDEINLAVAIGLLKEKDFISFLDEIDPKVHVYLTGRHATAGLKKRANYVNEIVMKKGPKKLIGEKGIDY